MYCKTILGVLFYFLLLLAVLTKDTRADYDNVKKGDSTVESIKKMLLESLNENEDDGVVASGRQLLDFSQLTQDKLEELERGLKIVWNVWNKQPIHEEEYHPLPKKIKQGYQRKETVIKPESLHSSLEVSTQLDYS